MASSPFLGNDEALVPPKMVDAAMRAYNDWPEDHPIDEFQRKDVRWVALRRALAAALGPEDATFDVLMSLARLIVDRHYPADIFVGGGPNTDPGVQLVVALRACDEARAAAAPTDTTEENTDGN